MIPEFVISENNQNQDLETFISMKSDAECNEITPAISFDRFHKDFEMFAKMMSKVGPVSSQTWGTHPADDRGYEALSSMGPHMSQKSTINHQKSMILKMNQDTYGNFLRYQE